VGAKAGFYPEAVHPVNAARLDDRAARFQNGNTHVEREMLPAAGSPRERGGEVDIGTRLRKARRAALVACLAGFAPAAGAETLALADVLAGAPPGAANGHVFAHLAVLDPTDAYVGGALVLEDTGVVGNGATLDLQEESILVAYGTGPTRFDIDHCLVVNGGTTTSGDYGGGIEFGAGTQGWVINNTFYDNYPFGVYLHEVIASGDATLIMLNIFYRDGAAGLVRNQTQPNVTIRYNDSSGNGQADFAYHCACPSEPFVEIFPGQPSDAPELDGSNFSRNPGFLQEPAPPKIPGDFHLADTSPCIGAGPAGEDLGAFPHGPAPAVAPLTWGALKARFRE
jgi:hypothetical protein